MDGVACVHTHGEHVARSAHLAGGPLGDARQHVLHIVAADQVGRGGEHAAQSLLHRVELGRHLLGALAVAVARLRLPADAIHAGLGPEGGALLVLDLARRQPEQHGRLRHQPAAPSANVWVRCESVDGARHDLGETGAGLDGL